MKSVIFDRISVKKWIPESISFSFWLDSHIVFFGHRVIFELAKNIDSLIQVYITARFIFKAS